MHETAATAKEIFLAALERATPNERAAYLSAACGDDGALRMRVEALLSAHDTPDSRLDRPAAEMGGTVLFRSITEGPGTCVGEYKLLQQIGEGGFGVVYMAEQQEPVRRIVALKIIKPGMDTKEVIARFESERQALALMDHPNIARVLDAGATDSGRPFFVMELVKGVPITEYCDKNNLATEQRLALFITVCRAVQHAHQKGIIHRDIKPSNVMVTLHDGHPVPKVIDFGVAKATSQKLTERTLFTAYGQMIGTPAYMSPEQAEMSGLDIDTRSDIYSLGVLLYELLTGSTPFDSRRLLKAGYAEMQRIIREEEPLWPSTRISTLGEKLTVLSSQRSTDATKLGQLLRGDLDLIVMKALEKERIRRYDTPNSFAADIERFLSHEPVVARAPTTLYRLRKFTERNKGAVIAGGAVAAVLVLATTLSTGLAIVAHQERNRALTATFEAQQNLTAANEQRSLAEISRTEALEAAQGERLATERAEASAAAERDAKDAEHQLREAADEKRRDIQRQNTEIAALNKTLQRQQDQQRRMLYTSDMNLIQTAWNADNIGRARDLLNGHRPQPGQEDLRGFEWHYWNRQLHAAMQTVKLPGELQGAMFSQDGGRVAGVQNVNEVSDRVIRVWDTVTGAELLALPVIRDAANSSFTLAFHPDGSRLAVSRLDRRDLIHLEIWEIATGKSLYAIQEQASVDKLQEISTGNREIWISDDGTRIALIVAASVDGNPQTVVKFWDANSGDELSAIPLPDQNPGIVTISRDGSRIAQASRTAQTKGGTSEVNIKIIEAAVLEKTVTIPLAGFASFRFSPDGKQLMVSGVPIALQTNVQEKGSALYDAASGHRINSLPEFEPWYVSRFSPDGKWLAATCRNRLQSVKLLSTLGDRTTIEIQGNTALVIALAFTRDGQRLVTATTDGQINIWDISGTTRPEPQRLNAITKWSSLMTAVTEGGSHIATSPGATALPIAGTVAAEHGRNVVTMHDDTGTVLYQTAELVGPIRWLKFSADGRRVAACAVAPTGDLLSAAQLCVWDTVTGEERLTLRLPAIDDGLRNLSSRRAPGAVLFPDGRQLAAVVYPNLDRAMSSITTAALTSSVKTWEIDTRREIWECEKVPYLLNDLKFGPDGARILGVPADDFGQLTVLDGQSGRLLWKTPERSSFSATGFGADGGRVFGFSKRNREIKLWEAASGQEVSTIRVPTFSVPVDDSLTSIALSPDGRRLAAGQSLIDSAAVKVWDVASPEHELFSLVGHSTSVRSIAFSPDSRRIATSLRVGLAASENSAEIKLWDAETGQELLTLPGVARTIRFLDNGAVLLGEMGTLLGGDFRVRRWDARPLSPQVEAAEVMNTLIARHPGSEIPLQTELLARIEADQSLTAEVRNAAEAQVKQLRREKKLNAAGWAIVVAPERPREKYARALSYLKEACLNDPTNLESWSTRALAHYRLGEFADALTALSRSRELHAAKKLSLPAEDLTILAMTKHETGQHDEAVSLLQKGRASASRNETEWQTLLGEAEKRLGIPQAADNPEQWIGQKVMPRKNGSPQDERDLAAYPQMPYVITRVTGDRLWIGPNSVARSQVVLFDEASRYYTEVLQADPEGSYGYYYYRAIVWRGLGEFNRAIDDHSVLLRVRPTDAMSRLNRGLVWQEKGELGKALADFDEVLRLEPSNADCHVSRGNVRVKQGEVDDAMRSFDEAIRLAPDLASAYSSRALAWSAKGDYVKARHDLDEAIRLNPGDTNALQSRSWYLATWPDAEHRDGKQSMADATKACQLLGWRDYNSLENLAAAYAEVGDFEQAIKWQEKALTLTPQAERADFESRLTLYREGKPYREMPKR